MHLISRKEFVDGLTVSKFHEPPEFRWTAILFLMIDLQKANVSMSQAQIDRLMDMLDQDGDGEIDYKCAWRHILWKNCNQFQLPCCVFVARELIHGDKEYKRKIMLRRKKEQNIMKKHFKRVQTVGIKNNPWRYNSLQITPPPILLPTLIVLLGSSI